MLSDSLLPLDVFSDSGTGSDLLLDQTTTTDPEMNYELETDQFADPSADLGLEYQRLPGVLLSSDSPDQGVDMVDLSLPDMGGTLNDTTTSTPKRPNTSQKLSTKASTTRKLHTSHWVRRSTRKAGGASSDIDPVTMATLNTSVTAPSTISSTTPPRSRQGRKPASTKKPKTSSTIVEATVSTSALRAPSVMSSATATATETVPHHATRTIQASGVTPKPLPGVPSGPTSTDSSGQPSAVPSKSHSSVTSSSDLDSTACLGQGGKPAIQPAPMASSSQNLVTSAPVTPPLQSPVIQADSSQSKSELQELCENNVHFWCDHADIDQLDPSFVTDPGPQRSNNQMGGASSDIDPVTMAILNTSTTMPSTISSSAPSRSRQARAPASTTKARTSSTTGEATVSTSALRQPTVTSSATVTATGTVPHLAIVTTTSSSPRNATSSVKPSRTTSVTSEVQVPKTSSFTPSSSPSTTATTTPTSNHPELFKIIDSSGIFNNSRFIQKSSTSSIPSPSRTPFVMSAASPTTPAAAPAVAPPSAEAQSTPSRLPKPLNETPVLVSQQRPVSPPALVPATSVAPVSSASVSSASGTSLISVSPSTSGSPEKSEHLEGGEKPAIKCPYCYDKFYTNWNLNRHLQTNHKWVSISLETCEICKIHFANPQRLKTHMRKKHPETLTEHTGVKCDICNKLFSNKYNLEAHKQKMHSIPKSGFPCPYCNKIYKYSTQRDIHIHNKHTPSISVSQSTAASPEKSILGREHSECTMQASGATPKTSSVISSSSPSTTATTTATSIHPELFTIIDSSSIINNSRFIQKSSSTSVPPPSRTPLVTSAALPAAPAVAPPAAKAQNTTSRLPKLLSETPAFVSQLGPVSPSARVSATSVAPVSSASETSASGTSLILVSPSTAASILGRKHSECTMQASGATPKPLHGEPYFGPPSVVPLRSVKAISVKSSPGSDSSAAQELEEKLLYQCSQCDEKPFHSPVYLDQHLKVVHGVVTTTLQTCEICKRHFADKNLLKQHMTQEHPETVPTPEGWWECDICKKVFSTKYNLQQHRQKVHDIQKTGVPCPHCGKIFKKPTELNIHIEKKHPGQPVVEVSVPLRYQHACILKPVSSQTVSSQPVGAKPSQTKPYEILEVINPVGGITQETGAQTLGAGPQPETGPQRGTGSNTGVKLPLTLGPEGHYVLICPKCSDQFPDYESLETHKQTCLQGTDSHRGAGSQSGAGPDGGAEMVCSMCSVVFPDYFSYFADTHTCGIWRPEEENDNI